MSLYNILFGKNKNSDIFLAVIGLKECDIERFRDVYLSEDQTQIIVCARTGGGNREDYPNKNLTSNFYYEKDEDEEFDSTYANYYFTIPAEIKEDFINFLNPLEKGVSAKFLQWIDKTLNRPETEDDKSAKMFNLHQKTILRLCQEGDLLCISGWIVVPLKEYGLKTVLQIMEDNGGVLLGYSLKPFTLMLNKKLHGYELTMSDNIDMDCLREWEKMYSNKYPKAIENLKKGYEEY